MNSTITPDRLCDLMDLVCVVVRGGIQFRHTMDTGLRHSLPPMERELLSKAEQMKAELRTAAVAVGEGGAA